MNKNYAILTLRIPLEIYETGKYKLYKERMDIGIERCTELPCQKNNSDYCDVLEVISEMFQDTEPGEKIKWTGTSGTGGTEEEEEEDTLSEDINSTEDYDLETTIDYGNESDSEEGTEGTEQEEEDAEGTEEEKNKKIIEPELRVYSHEMKPRKKHGTLMTFKNRIKPKNTFTRKLLNMYESNK